MMLSLISYELGQHLAKKYKMCIIKFMEKFALQFVQNQIRRTSRRTDFFAAKIDVCIKQSV